MCIYQHEELSDCLFKTSGLAEYASLAFEGVTEVRTRLAWRLVVPNTINRVISKLTKICLTNNIIGENIWSFVLKHLVDSH